MSSSQQDRKETRCGYERSAAVQHPSVSGVNNAAESNKSFHVPSGHHPVTANVTLTSTDQCGGHPKGLTLFTGGRAHVRQQGDGDRDIAAGCRAVRCDPVKQCHGAAFIPPPVRRFTTTNPNTLSPTYHLFYDLTKHLPRPSVPGGDGCYPNKSSSKSAPSRTDQSHSVPNYRVSGDELSDESNMTLGRRCTSTNHSVPTFTDIKLEEINEKPQTTSNFRSDILSRHQESMCGPSATQADAIERTRTFPEETPPHSRFSDSEFADINANTSYSAAWVQHTKNIFNNSVNHATREDFSRAHNRPAANISAPVVQKQTGLPARQWKSRDEKTQLQREELDSRGDQSYPVVPSLDRVPCVHSNTETERMKVSVTQTLANEEDTNVTVHKAVHFWNSNAAAQVNSSPGPPLKPDVYSSEHFKTIPHSQFSGEELDAKLRKRAVFKREGDSVRMFMVSDRTPCNHDSGVASDAEIIPSAQEKPAVVPMWSTDYRKNSNSSLLSLPNFLLESLKSKSKQRGTGAPKDNVKTVGGVVTINNDLLSGGGGPRVSKNQVNRWNNLHVRSAPSLSAGADEGKRICATKEKSSAQSGLSTPALDSRKPALGRDPACHRTVGGEGGRTGRADNVGSNGPSKSAIKGILVNKDNVPTGCRSGHTHKANSVQFSEDSLNTEDNVDSGDPLKQRGESVVFSNTSSATSRKDVIDRSKYIIKRSVGTDGQHNNLNLSGDTTRSPSSDSLDNFYPAGDRITPQANSLERRDPSVKSDTRVDVRQSTLESRVALENRHGQSVGVIRISQANPHSSKLSSVDNSGFRTGDAETYTPGLDKHHVNSSTDRTRREQQELSLPLESHSSRDGRSQLTALDNNRIAHSHNCNFETLFPINVDRTTKCVDIAESRLADLSSIKNKDKKDYSNERRDVGDLSLPSSHHPSEQKAPQKIRPRQKFEIRHNKTSGKVGAQLRLNSQVNGDASETKYLDEDIGSDPANVTLPQHKESPRARFERDRAARSHAVTTGEPTTDSLCERFKGDHKSDGGTLPGFIPLTSDNPVGVIAGSSRCSGCVDDASPPPELPPPKLPPRVKLANEPLAASTVVSNSDRFTDNKSISLNSWLQSNPDIKPDTSETFVTCRQQHAEDTREISGERFPSSERKYISKDNYFISVDSQKQRFPHLDCSNSDQENIINRNSSKDLCCDSKPELTDNLRSHVVDDSRQSGHDGLTFNSVKNKLSPNNLLTQTEILSNQNTTASAHHFGDSGFKPRAAGGQRVSALKKVSPDSASSSGYDSEVNTSAIKTFFQGIDCVSNNEYIRQVLTRSSVQQLRLLFGHEDDHQESVKPQRPRDTGVLTSSPASRWRCDEDFNGYDVSDIQNCSTDSNLKSRSPVGDATRRILKDGLHVNSSSSCQDKQNKEAGSSSDYFANVFPVCCSQDSPRQYLGPESIEEYDRHAPWPLQCAPCEDWLESCDPSSGTALCPQTKEEHFSSSVGNDVEDFNTRSGLSYIRALVVSEAEAEMLASKGIRIYESGDDYVAMVSPVKSPLHKSLSSPQFVWEGTTYLIIPTVLDSLGTSAVHNDSTTSQNGNNSNPDLFTHRSISDSGAPGHFLDNARGGMNGAPVNDKSDVYLTMTSSASGKLTEQSRAMSVEVLCTKDVKPDENWDHVTPSVGLVRRRKNKLTNDRGYVEWKTCSGWVGNTDMRTAPDCRNSQGYVEWDTIWTTDAPWRSPPKGDEHVYDVIAEDQGPAAQKTSSSPTNGSDAKDSAADGVDTPPALPERTYIHRIKNINTNSASHDENVCVRGAHTPPSSRHNHSGHPVHNCGCIKHHHHHHHQHQHHRSSGKHHKSSPPRLTADATSTNPPPTPMPFSGQQHKHTGGVHSPQAAGGPQVWPSPGDPSQNYAEVNKLRGYTFSNLMLAADSPAPHRPDKTAVSSENYWHLAPMTSPDSVSSWQTGDVLDYIDGLHDSMSPKRRENIYILLNNKKTRAKFSESLEIESRLLSRGLISNSCEGPSDKFSEVPPTVKSGTVKPVVIRRKGAIAPVSSTYV